MFWVEEGHILYLSFRFQKGLMGFVSLFKFKFQMGLVVIGGFIHLDISN